MHTVNRLVILWLILWCSPLIADDTEAPLYEQEPFDQIQLNEANGNQVLKVRPLDLPNRRVPPDFNKGDPLEFYRYDNPRELLRVDRHAIVKIEIFENLVLQEANSLTGKGQFDEAYWHYYHLTQNYPHTENLNTRLEGFLVRNAGQSFDSSVLDKVKWLRAEHKVQHIMIDGGMDELTIIQAAQAGANVIVSGSSIFALRPIHDKM